VGRGLAEHDCGLAVNFALQGYYEGQQLLDLTRWLAAAALESEGPLLARLCAIPWPYKPSLVVKAAKAAATAAAASAGVPEPQSPNSFSYWVGFAGGHPGSNTAAVGGPAGGANQATGLTAVQAGVQPGGPLLQGLGLRLPHERQLMSSADMRRRRPNGYAGLVAPALYGEAGACFCEQGLLCNTCQAVPSSLTFSSRSVVAQIDSCLQFSR
jgi:hypothetical protein